jgi:hypothetical protein
MGANRPTTTNASNPVNTTTKTTWHLTAAMPHPNSQNLAKAGLGFGKLFAVILLMASAVPLQPAHAQIAGAVRSAAARAAVRTAERGAVVRIAERKVAARAVTRQPVRTSCSATKNKCASLPREAAAQRILAGRYPNERIQPETYLRNRNGTRAIDPKTGKGRRIDFVLFSRDGYTRRYEVTSQTADKRAQLAKEQRILAHRRNGRLRNGPVYVRDRSTGRLVPVRSGPSKIIRFQ